MTRQIINLAEYRKAKEAEEVRRVVNDYSLRTVKRCVVLSTAPAR